MMRIEPIVLAALSLALTGCSLSTTATPTPDHGVLIQGNVHGGQQPYVSSRVYLLAANTTGYGNASASLLNAGPSTTLDEYYVNTYGDYYTLTDGNGSFSITGDYACAAGTQVYLYVAGGRPAGANILANGAASFMAVLGTCPNSGSFLASIPFISVNEVTTVAAAYALAGFATDSTHVSSSGTKLAQTGVANAFANAANLASIATGAALTTTPAGNGTVPQATLNTLADILASCINSNDNTANTPTLFSNQCLTLVGIATSDGTATGTQPGDTATVAINIAHHPGSNVGNLYVLAAANPPFLPTLSAQPNDWTVGLVFSGGGLDDPNAVAIDASGNAWFTNPRQSCTGCNGSITKLSNTGAPVSPSAGFTGGGLSTPSSIAIDGVGNAWAPDSQGYGTVAEFSATGVPLSPPTGYTGGGLGVAFSIAIDGYGNIWTAGTTVSKFSSSGIALSPPTGYTKGGYSIAIDGSGDAWLTSYGGASVFKFSNEGAVLSPASGYTG